MLDVHIFQFKLILPEMRNFHVFSSPLIVLVISHVFLSPLVSSLSYDNDKNSMTLEDNIHKLSPKMISEITLHGVLLWASMGFLMPLGTLAIRMLHRRDRGRQKFFFYIHVILQTLSALLVTAGAIMSIRSFENLFNNHHQRIGLALYGAIWVPVGTGIFRPRRGNKNRRTWYIVHWMLGTIVSIFGIINIYTGLGAYHKKTLRSTRIWTILFTAQVSFMAFFYLFQDKWDYMRKQGVNLGEVEPITPTINQDISQSDINQLKVLVPEPCGKKNALKNLFD